MLWTGLRRRRRLPRFGIWVTDQQRVEMTGRHLALERFIWVALGSGSSAAAGADAVILAPVRIEQDTVWRGPVRFTRDVFNIDAVVRAEAATTITSSPSDAGSPSGAESARILFKGNQGRETVLPLEGTAGRRPDGIVRTQAFKEIRSHYGMSRRADGTGSRA